MDLGLIFNKMCVYYFEGLAMEPSILRKKRTRALPASTGEKEFVLLGNQRKFAVNIPYQLPSFKSKPVDVSRTPKVHVYVYTAWYAELNMLHRTIMW